MTMKRLSVQDMQGNVLGVAVCATDTLFGIRPNLTALLWADDDCEPATEFRFLIGNQCLSESEEGAMLCWDVIGAKKTVKLCAAGESTNTSDWTVSNSQTAAMLVKPPPHKKPRCGRMAFQVNQSSPPFNNAGDLAANLEERTITTQSVAKEDTNTITDILPANKQGKDIHGLLDESQDHMKDLLKTLQGQLDDPQNRWFCPPLLRQELCSEIRDALAQSEPYVTIGCLGGTGVGKSSLLNALLNEADILPTSGSRGCTAAVVELRFNRDFLNPKDQTTVYEGCVEFISLSDWKAELELLVDDCCCEGTETISARCRESNDEAAAAWSKIDSVYGAGTVKSFDGKDKTTVFNALSKDPRVVELLQGKDGQSNTIVVREGTVDKRSAKQLLEYCRHPTSKKCDKNLLRDKKKWSAKFRGKINDYVYRKGRGKEPQTWPLIRKVVLRGPWAVLSTGACLVDMPGVRDANIARAKVAERYLQNCHKIWIVSPIKRAVDDKTAKDLLGDEFKRRLLMDGQYSNVSFICTHADDCEISEILRDHEDVARSETGRWEQMNEWKDRIEDIQREESENYQEREELEGDLNELKGEIRALHSEIEEFTGVQSEKDTSSSETLNALKKSLHEKKDEASALSAKIHALGKDGSQTRLLCDEKRDMQRKLKATASQVRNEFSTNSLRIDFRNGLEELARNPDDDEPRYASELSNKSTSSPLPDDFQLEVYCIASNEYLKIQGIKGGMDGNASCFEHPKETQIPDLVDSVHNTTAQFRKTHNEKLIKVCGSLLERAFLCAKNDKVDATVGKRLRAVFENKAAVIQQKIDPIASGFSTHMAKIIESDLEPSLRTAAMKGNQTAMATVLSWSSSNRRTKQERGPGKNGLHWSTYGATMRRFGVFKSAAAGQINLNQELCDPMEKEFSAKWERIMVSAVDALVENAMLSVLACCNELIFSMVIAFREAGMDPDRALSLANGAKRSCDMAVRDAFGHLQERTNSERKVLNRSLLGKVAKRMVSGYSAARDVPRGTGGVFMRQTKALEKTAKQALTDKFDPMMTELLAKIGALRYEVASTIRGVSQVVRHGLLKVYSVCWHDRDYEEAAADPKVRFEILQCREKLLPELARLRKANDTMMGLMGVDRSSLDFQKDTMDGGLDEMTINDARASENEEVGLASMPTAAYVEATAERFQRRSVLSPPEFHFGNSASTHSSSPITRPTDRLVEAIVPDPVASEVFQSHSSGFSLHSQALGTSTMTQSNNQPEMNFEQSTLQRQGPHQDHDGIEAFGFL